ncbi:MAG: YitT family protein [Bacilli bacterium]|nr:YitT family protein [Bacteroidales bacterium]MDD4188028.1 YitT family protein [Bacilli bacterium]
MKKYLKIIAGSLLIALAFNVFFLPYEIVPNGIYGIAALLNYKIGYDPSLFLILVNFSLIIISLIALGEHKSKEYVWPGLLIPLFIFLESTLNNYIALENFEKIMAVITGSFITGIGYSLIYKEGKNVGGADIIQDIINSATIYRNHFSSYIIEGLVLLGTLITFGLENMIYSLIVIVIVRYMTTRTKIGISSSKTFYIITTKEVEVKKYIMEELKNDLTEFKVKGGYSKNKSKILMTVMDTKSYYVLKEGILLIDPKAFISIVDSYEVINKNVTLSRADK